MSYERCGLQYQEWDDIVAKEGKDAINHVATIGSYRRGEIPEDLRQELEALYPEESWAPLWEHERRKSILFERVIGVTAHGGFSPADVVRAFGSKEGLLQLREDAKTLMRRQAACAQLRQLSIAERTLHDDVTPSL